MIDRLNQLTKGLISVEGDDRPYNINLERVAMYHPLCHLLRSFHAAT